MVDIRLIEVNIAISGGRVRSVTINGEDVRNEVYDYDVDDVAYEDFDYDGNNDPCIIYSVLTDWQVRAEHICWADDTVCPECGSKTTSSQERSLLVTSHRLTRSTLDRILYGGWSVMLWAEGPEGAVALVSCEETTASGGFGVVAQADRIRSLGGVGVKHAPTQDEVLDAAMRVKRRPHRPEGTLT